MGLDTVELVMAFEEEFDLRIPNDVAERLQTVGDVTDYLCERLDVVGRDDARSAVFWRVCRITAEQAGVKVEELSDETSFVNDLGMD